jgi:hypothetical protein
VRRHVHLNLVEPASAAVTQRCADLLSGLCAVATSGDQQHPPNPEAVDLLGNAATRTRLEHDPSREWVVHEGQAHGGALSSRLVRPVNHR